VASGITSLAQITNAIETFVDEVQYITDDEGIFEKLIRTKRMPRSKGLTLHEPNFGTLTAADLTDGTIFDDPTLVTDSGFTLTPTEKGVQVLWSDRLVRAMRDNFPRIAAEMMANALAYRMDQDLITIAQSGGGTLGSGSIPATSGLISGAVRSIQVGIPIGSQVARTGARSTGERSKGPWNVVLHPYNGHDLFGQWTATAGTSALTGAVAGNFSRAADVSEYSTSWLNMNDGGEIPGLKGAHIYWDGNIPIIAGPEAKGAAFDENAMLNLMYADIMNYRDRTVDGRNTRLTLWNDYAPGLRVDVHLVVLRVDATAPTV
jgi:hypothetical protein